MHSRTVYYALVSQKKGNSHVHQTRVHTSVTLELKYYYTYLYLDSSSYFYLDVLKKGSRCVNCNNYIGESMKMTTN